MRETKKASGVFAGALLLCSLPRSHGQSIKRAAATMNETATSGEVAWYIREKYGVADSVKLTVGSFHSSANPDYYDCIVTADDGKQPKSQNISVSKDARYLAMSSMYPLGADMRNDILGLARRALQIPPNMNLDAGDLQDSVLPDFLKTTMTFGEGQKKQTLDFFVTKDHRFLVLGSVFLISRRDVARSITLRNQPYAGAMNAPVTIVEYADLQCPTCARLHELFEKELLPKYANKIRVVFKEFPLPMHDWSHTAAVANQCAYQSNPAAFVKYRSLIFQNQPGINVANVRDRLLQYGEQAGIDRVKLAACIESNASLARVEQNLHEAEKVQVSRTPTCFINGRVLVGLQTLETFSKVIDDALRAR